ncbi:hypothetical protein GCM10007423_00620 [Dyadobacter endophyticus]|uniref:Uncharacterized protein n=1 Tax=Dyadobacter endophyticus TaxID=1749036 RepID=A0ABQ1YD56_9BACT|nr:hypothetical protein [Dyadobacter endophyticus]GGH20288.1 hypothetical protein GCM10007423_00620 [Dyadobacter endophyticus]
MFYRFKPSRSQQPAGRQYQKLQAKIISIQRAWANRLNSRAQRLSARRLKAALIASGLAASAAAAGLIYYGINPPKLTLHRFELSLPAISGSNAVPESPLKQQALDQYLDSVEKAFILDSIQNTKPQISHDASPLH